MRTPTATATTRASRPLTVAHLTTIDSSLHYLLYPQLTAARDLGATAWDQRPGAVRRRAGPTPKHDQALKSGVAR